MNKAEVNICSPTRHGVECVRFESGPKTSVEKIVVHHSPDGYEWGFAGSGPADLALNILAHFLPIEGSPHHLVGCFKGNVSKEAWELHQDFKFKFIACMEEPGGYIPAAYIQKWIDKNLKLKGLR